MVIKEKHQEALCDQNGSKRWESDNNKDKLSGKELLDEDFFLSN